MLEKINQMAEQAATNASRRQFLERFGRGAMAAAAAVGGLLALPAQAATVCGPGSAGQCRGRPVGSVCGTRNRPGRCEGPPKLWLPIVAALNRPEKCNVEEPRSSMEVSHV